MKKNKIEIEVELKNYDEVMEKLHEMKKLLDSICNNEDETSEPIMESVVENDTSRSSIKFNSDGTIDWSVNKKEPTPLKKNENNIEVNSNGTISCSIKFDWTDAFNQLSDEEKKEFTKTILKEINKIQNESKSENFIN